jgi:hypothetical protein
MTSWTDDEVGGTVWSDDEVGATDGTLSGSEIDVDADKVRVIDATDNRPKLISVGELVANTSSFTQSGSGASSRDVQSKLRYIVSIEDFGGSASASAATNDTALDAAITKLGSNGGDIIFESCGDYQFAAQHNLTRDINLIGQHTPGADAADAPTGTRINRTADVILFNLVGTNRTTDRVGRNRFVGLQFVDDTNISDEAFFDCKYADSLVFENCTFWQPDGQTTAGHFIDAEECWDWRFWNVIFKHYGTAAAKHAINVYNGTADNSNGWIFVACRWQEGLGSAVNFDSSGVGGSNNHDFQFIGCKMEDTGNAAKSHVTGTASDVKIVAGEYGGCGERQISMASGSTRWRITDATFANGGATATEFIELLGTKARVAGCTFQGPGASVTRYINSTGADAEITGCNRANTTVALVNESGASATRKVHHNTDYLTEYGATATIADGSNNVVVTHSQSYTPNLWDITVHFTGAPNNSIDALRISTITSTQFTVTAYAAGVATAASGASIGIAWAVRRVRG